MTTRTLKNKGAASAATDPRPSPETLAKGSKMNAHVITTPMVPHPAQTPHLDLDGAMALLRILHDRLLTGPLGRDDAAHFSFLVGEAFELMEPVRDYLDAIAHQAGHQELYLDARRQWVLARQGVQS